MTNLEVQDGNGGADWFFQTVFENHKRIEQISQMESAEKVAKFSS